MKPLTIIYWTRFSLGILAGLICAFLSELAGSISIFNGISVALLIYIVSYYIYKPLFLTKVEKPTKLFSTGVGAYFLAWIVSFVLLFTLVAPAMTIASPAPGAVFSAGETVTITARIASPLGAPFSGVNVTANSPTQTLIRLNETSPGMYSAVYNIPSLNATDWNIKVNATINGEYREASVTVHIQAAA